MDTGLPWPTNLSAGFWVTNSAGYFVDRHTNLWLGITNTVHTKVVSPEAPDDDLTNEAEFIVAPFRIIMSNAPISFILNTGERDLGTMAGDGHAWQFDPRVIAKLGAIDMSFVAPYGMARYASQQKAHQLSILASALRAAVPNAGLIWYFTGNEQHHETREGAGDQSATNSWWNTVYDLGGAGWWSSYLLGTNTTGTNVGLSLDMPSYENYYSGIESRTNIGIPANGNVEN